MSGHLCLKWNNHCSAFITSIGKIQLKERYCDATIACQGKYFPVHRIVLSTCSEYFDEMFQRMQCQHPYIVFKDIEPREMELLLNYMYQGEVNVVQEMLPTLIKAAEALKVKGLAVPDDMPVNNNKEPGRKRSNPGTETPQPKRRSEESRRRRTSLDLSNQSEASDVERQPNKSSTSASENLPNLSSLDQQPIIKQEPLDSAADYNTALNSNFVSKNVHPDGSGPSLSNDSAAYEETEFGAHDEKDKIFIKMEEESTVDPVFANQSSSWSDFGGENPLSNVPSSEMGNNDDMSNEMAQDEHLFDRVYPFDTEPDGQTASSVVPQRSQLSGRCHICPYCSYSSRRIGNMKRHVMMKHTGERPFPCRFCPMRFVEKIALRRHVRVHTGEQPYECPYCRKKFALKGNLKVHVKHVHLPASSSVVNIQ